MQRVAVWLAVLVFVSSGCAAQSRTVTITTKPAGAKISIDGIVVGYAPLTHRFDFPTGTEVHRVYATRRGYMDHPETVTLASARPAMNIELRRLSRQIYLLVQPGPAIVKIDGTPVSPEPVSSWQVRLDVGVDEHEDWVKHTVTAERPNFQPASISVSWPDRDQTYVLNLEPMRKDLAINSSPSGAQVYLDDELIGTTPLRDTGRAFPVDPATNNFILRTLKIVKSGYKPLEKQISWDNAKTDYRYDLSPRSKVVRIRTDPPGAAVSIEGQELPRDSDGVASTELSFAPIDENGELRTYNGTAVKTGEGEWEPAKFIVGWDDGRTEYTIPLKEILTRTVPLMSAVWSHENGKWEVAPRVTDSIGMKDVTDGHDRPASTMLTQLAKGTFIDTLAVSPDGQHLLFTALSGKDKNDFKSQMFVVRTDGEAGADLFSDGKSLDITPSYSPGGDQIVFASNRGGPRLSIWRMSTTGTPGITQLTSGDTNDLWPVVDSDARARLYYQAMNDNRGEPRLFAAQLGNMFRTDLQITGMQPRVSPKNDSLVYTSINQKTGKRDIFLIPVGGGTPQNLTATPDIDDCDPVWNRDGSKIAFASDRGADADKRHNYDIWIMDLHQPGNPRQVTTNGSQDDCPGWDPSGAFIYYRSNRGGEWGIWKMRVK